MEQNNLGYLLHHVSFLLDRHCDQVLQERLGLGFSQYKILHALKWQTTFRQKEIAGYLGQTEASVSRQIKLLQKAGLVKSKISPRSKREHLVTLTVKGEHLADQATDILNQTHEPAFAHLTPKQLTHLNESLSVLHRYVCPSPDH